MKNSEKGLEDTPPHHSFILVVNVKAQVSGGIFKIRMGGGEKERDGV